MLCGQGAVDVRSCALSVWLPCDCTRFTLQYSPLTTRWQQITTSDPLLLQTTSSCLSLHHRRPSRQLRIAILFFLFLFSEKIPALVWLRSLLWSKIHGQLSVTIRANVRTMQLLQVSHRVYIHISLSRVVFLAQYTENCAFWTQRIIYLMLESFIVVFIKYFQWFGSLALYCSHVLS